MQYTNTENCPKKKKEAILIQKIGTNKVSYKKDEKSVQELREEKKSTLPEIISSQEPISSLAWMYA